MFTVVIPLSISKILLEPASQAAVVEVLVEVVVSEARLTEDELPDSSTSRSHEAKNKTAKTLIAK